MLKSRDITLPTKVHLVKAMIFPVVMYGCESWTIKKSEHQRIARRDKRAFLSDQYKEIEENSRMGKTRDLLKKIRDTKGTFHSTTAEYTFLLKLTCNILLGWSIC